MKHTLLPLTTNWSQPSSGNRTELINERLLRMKNKYIVDEGTRGARTSSHSAPVAG